MITIKNRFLAPRIEDLFDKPQRSTYFSRIDLKTGYHQIRIVPKDIPKTAFRTTFGLYKYLVMPFGLTNAPATFNRMMEQLFRPHRTFTVVFFDDIIIYSKTLEEHKRHLRMIFELLKENKLYINQKMSELFLKEIQYLGHIISHLGIHMDPKKLEVIKGWPIPTNLHEHLKDHPKVLLVFLYGLRVDYDVIKEDTSKAMVRSKKLLHHAIKGGRCVCKAKRHYKILVQAKHSTKGCLGNIFWHYPNLVITTFEIYSTKVSRSL